MVGIKPYACGVGKHGLIDAMLSLRLKDKVTPENVERITGSVRAFKSQDTLRHPTTGVQASFSYHHSIAVALVDGAAFPAQYSDDRAKDPFIASVRDKIEVTADLTLARGVVTATVVLKDGRTYKKVVEHPTGSPEQPMTDAQVEAKFFALAGEVLPQEHAARLLEESWRIDKIGDVRELAKLMSHLDTGK